MKKFPILACTFVAVASLSIASCQGKNSDPPATTKAAAPTVWANLGGEANVRKVVDDFVGRAASDPTVDFFRKNVPGHEWKPNDAQVANLKQKLVELVSSGTGGPFEYTGRSMMDVHKGMMITTAEFNALAGHLDAALRAGGAQDADRSAVMAFAASTLGDIVEVK